MDAGRVRVPGELNGCSTDVSKVFSKVFEATGVSETELEDEIEENSQRTVQVSPK